MLGKRLKSSIICGAMFVLNWFNWQPLHALPSSEDDKKDPNSFSGNVSWYGRGFNGKKTASGELFDMSKCTAAHLHLAFGTRVLVEDPRTGKTVLVKVNDRGPFVKTRIMDMAREGAKRLGTLSQGVVFVDCLIVKKADES